MEVQHPAVGDRVERTVPVSYTHLDVYKRQQYTKVPCGTLCKTQHRINEDVVLSLVSEMPLILVRYSSLSSLSRTLRSVCQNCTEKNGSYRPRAAIL